MKLVSYRDRGADPEGWRAGLLDGDEIVAAEALTGGATSVKALIALEDTELARLADGIGGVGPEDRARLDSVELGPPVPDPEKVICVGLNYRSHAGEVDMEIPPAPILFAKFASSLTGHDQPIVLPPQSGLVDYEGELGVVIGKRCRNVGEADAMSVVAGCMPFNDVSARDLQMKVSQWTAGKAIDTFGPCGPALVTPDEFGDVDALGLETRLNGRVVQTATTDMMLFSVRYLIAYISSLMTLKPGDVIATGTPSGVGFTREPPLELSSGDTVEVEISHIGTLRNHVERSNGSGA